MKDILKYVISGIVIVFTLWMGFIGVNNHIESLVLSYVQSEEVIEEISNRFNKYVIFDGNGSVLHENNSESIFDRLEILDNTTEKGGFKYPSKIKFIFKKYLPTQPVLTVINSYDIVIFPERGKMYDWVFGVECYGRFSSDRPDMLFKLEILD